MLCLVTLESSCVSYPITIPLPSGQRLPIPCAHDECTFHSHDGRHYGWIHKDKHAIQKMSLGQGLMVLDFILPCHCLEIPPSLPLPLILPQRETEPIPGLKLNPSQATESSKGGQGCLWNGQNLIDHLSNIVIPIFKTTFPHTQVLFLCDHAISHTAEPDALQVSHMNMDPGGKQPYLRDGWFYKPIEDTLYTQKMSFDQNDLLVPAKWRGKPKGCKQVLHERCLWPPGGLRHDCKSKKAKEDHSYSSNSCYTRRWLSVKPGFLEQKSRLQEEIEKRGHLCLFFPKFQC